ncbi:hypothetical protein MNBD_ALPHA06-209, partial [hydrothermal vent metagenome]
KLRDFQQNQPDIHLLEGHGNIGFAKACNLGAKAAKTKYLMFLNPDAILQPGALTQLVQVIEGEPAPCVAGARLLNQDGSEQRGSRRGKLTPWSALVSMSGLARFEAASPLFTDMHWERRIVPNKPQSVPAVSGACMMFRASDFWQLDGFDQGYFLHVEDLDICRRVIRQQGRVLFVPDAQIVHIGSTSKANIYRVNWSKAKGLVRYFYRFSNSFLERVIAMVLAPLVVAAIMIRTVLIRLSQ